LKAVKSILVYNSSEVVGLLRISCLRGFSSIQLNLGMRPLELIECPRDAIQGWPHPVSTADKLAYYRTLLDVGFNCLDLGSFVSHKAVPQMADTRAVCNALHDEGKLEGTTSTLVIVANERGAKEALATPGIDFIGFPLSLSETFQLRNTKATSTEALERLQNIRSLVEGSDIRIVVYLSMGFGNPYGDDWGAQMVTDWTGKLNELIKPEVVSLSDTVGQASPDLLKDVFTTVFNHFPNQSIGAHLHATPWDAPAKIQAAWDAGCRRFDGALRGIGGCPMAQDALVGNLATETIVETLGLHEKLDLDMRAWNQAMSLAVDLFQSA